MTQHGRLLLLTLAFSAGLALCAYSLPPAQTSSSQPQENGGGTSGHDAMDMGGMQHDHAMPVSGSTSASPGSDTEWSVFNHRGAAFSSSSGL